MLDEARALHPEQYVPQSGWIHAIFNTLLALERGSYAAVATLVAETLPINADIHARAISLYRLGPASAAQGDLAAAEQHYSAVLRVFEEIAPPMSFLLAATPGSFSGMTRSLSGLAHVALWRYGAEAGLAWLDEQHALIADRTGVDVRGLARGVRERLLIAAGRYGEAAAGLVEALGYFRRAGARPRLAGALELVAAVLAARGGYEQAARTWGAAVALRGALGTPMWPVDRPDYERRVAAAREAWGAATWDAAWDSGRALTWEQAADEARAALGATGGRA
jgi:hypothetical protein